MVAGSRQKARPAQDCKEEKNSRSQTDSTKRVKVSRLATPDIILKSVKEVLSQKGRFHLVTVS